MFSSCNWSPEIWSGCTAHRAWYNKLLDDSAQPPVADEHITHLAEIFVHHNAHDVLGIHLIHGHFNIPEGTVTDIDRIDPTSVHGHIFALTKDGLCAYELQDGPLPNLSHVGPRFLNDFTDYIVKNNLAGLIGLQVLGWGARSMSELILDQGTVMLDSSCVKNTEPTRITGWRFESVNGNPRVCSANETRAQMTSGCHKIFNAGKPLPKLDNVEDLKAALTGCGVL
ncbi:hypothetical protein AJ78_05814 [Emergomyces pasteurianus Ep9510]|uniref:Uncharacterized protein n=1 Tax=Emergomyces pasteurianus Ep9510 TaxID=1447872 RepID=A0A1J9QCV2_9EURO|nr:hypothetical protein AJ78_05814 [Emergomyces pasteurianus Ep9510]